MNLKINIKVLTMISNYDLEKNLINFDLDEIQGIMFQAIQRKVDKDHMIDEVVKKMSLTFSQDIILWLKLNGFSNKHPDLFKKIIEGYNQGEHNNLKSFLEKMTQKKNIIYTYNNNLEKIKILNPIDTKIIGRITEENIKEININKFKSENEFEKAIDDFLENEEEKICFIKFNSNEGSFINYSQFFLENKLKDFSEEKKEKNQEKIFIFIVNIMRIYDYELEELKDEDKKKANKAKKAINKKILKETISNLSDYYQIFIDNLYGPDGIKLDSIFFKKGLDIFENFLDFNAELSKNIYKTLSYMKLNIPFSYGELNEDTYINKLIKYISNNEDIIKSFNECVKKQIGDKGNKKDLIKEIFTKQNIIKENNKDIIEIIREKLSKEYANYLAQFYFKAEKDNFFATLLSLEEEKKFDESKKEEINKLQEDIKKRYFSEFKINKNQKIVTNQGQNLITIYLGMKEPKTIDLIKIIINFIKEEIEKKYIKNENKLREDPEAYKSNYYQNLNLYNENLYVKISKQISEYIKENKNNKIYNIFLEDFYTYFIFENVKNLKEKNLDKEERKKQNQNIKLNDIKIFLKFLVKINDKQNTEEDPIKKIASNINWIYCHKDNISTILQMFSTLSTIVNNLNDKIQIAENELEDKYKSSNLISSMVDKALFFGTESLIRVLTSNSDIYLSAKEDSEKFYELMNNNKEILQSAFKLKANLNLKSKEVFSLREIIEINEAFINKGIDTKENIKTVLEFFLNETSLILDDNKDELLKNSFKEFYTFLEGLLEKTDLFNKLMSIIFYDEYMKISKEVFRNELLNIITSKDDFIYNCFPLLKKIIKNMGISIKPEKIKNNLEDIKKGNYKMILILNQKKSIVLEQIILQILEHFFLDYFDNLSKGINKEDKKFFKKYFDKKENRENRGDNYKKYILFDLSLEIFEECINTLDSYYHFQNSRETDDGNKNYNSLSKLYAIAYIKIYLSKFIEFLDNYDEMEIKIIMNKMPEENNLMNVFKIYILKIFYNSKNRNWEKFLADNFTTQEYFDKLLNDNSNSEANGGASFLINYFMPSNEEEERMFKAFTKDFINIIAKEDESSEYFSDEKIKNFDTFLTVAINKILSNLFLKRYLDFEMQYNNYII